MGTFLSWRMSTVFPIQKPGKDPKNYLTYRPVAFTKCNKTRKEKNQQQTYL